MTEPRGKHRRHLQYPWSRALVPGWVHLTQGRVIAGMLALAVFWLLALGLVAVVFLALFKPDVLTSAAVTTSTLNRIFLFLVIVGGVYVVASLVNLMSMRSDSRFRKSRIGIGVVLTAIVLQSLGFGAAAAGVNMQRNLMHSLFVDPNALNANGDGTASAADLKPLTGRINVLLLGGDAGANRWAVRPDSISVANIDFSTGRIVMVGIPRNLERAVFAKGSPMLGPFPHGYDCGHTCLINAIYTYASGHSSLYSDAKYNGKIPGVEATREAVEGTLGITVDYFAMVDMMGFANIVDSVGGVNVNVPRRVVTQYGKVYEPGCQHMTGRQALLFARTRKDSSDYNRMAKQRLVQESLLRQIDPINLFRAYSEVARNGSQYITTDLPEPIVADLLRVATKSRHASFASLDLVPPRISVVHPNIDEIHAMVEKAIATGTAPKNPQGFASPGPTTAPSKAPLSSGQTYAKTKPCK